MEVYHRVEHAHKVPDSVLELLSLIVFGKLLLFITLVVHRDELEDRHEIHLLAGVACEDPFVHDPVFVDIYHFWQVDLVMFGGGEAQGIFELWTFARGNYFLNDSVDKVEVLGSLLVIVVVFEELKAIFEILKGSV